jgi:glucose/arabinose dehydrogenase
MPRRSPTRTTASVTAFVLVGAGLAAVPAPKAEAVPSFTATTVVSGLANPWDITWVGSRLLYTLKAGEVWAKADGASPQRVVDLRSSTADGSEGGLLGIVADPGAATNRTFYTCGAYRNGNGAPVDVRVRRWQLTTAGTSAAELSPVVTGLPLTTGRHSGCRLRFGTDGKLYVGTGDAAVGTVPQDRNSLGGKVLRVNATGGAPTDNPFYADGGNARYVWTYGHRNVQGLALRPGTSQLWSAEHGPARDDEINQVVRGGNYGWDPDGAGDGYDESVPMTDVGQFPTARRATWSSGSPTVATSGLTFLTGSAWGRWQGAMAVGLLKDQGIMIITLRPDGSLALAEPLPAGEGYGRIRTVQLGPDGALYFTTSNGSNDRIVKLTPRPPRTWPAYSPGLDVSPVGVAAARTGSEVYLFVRGSDEYVYFRRSTDNARTWGGWTNTGVRSTSAPAVASSARGRIDLLTRSATNSAVHTWFVSGARAGQLDLGGVLSAAPAVSSLGDGTLDVFVRGQGSGYGGHRKHWEDGSWSSWQSLGGVFSSALAASANVSTGSTVVTGRGSDGRAWERTVTASGNGTSGWVRTGLILYSARALGSAADGIGVVGVSSGSDTNAVVDRGSLVMGFSALYDSAPAVVTRTEGEWSGTWLMFGRSSNGGAWLYDARPGGYRNVSLGGTLT